MGTQNYIGQRFGTRVCYATEKTRLGTFLLLRCDCGHIGRCLRQMVDNRECKSCVHRKHGHSPEGSCSPTYSSWRSMVARCTNPKHKEYDKYSKIGMCDRWRDFATFLRDMGERPPETSIDRVNNDRGYEPGNCRWATRSQQQRNTRANVFLTINGETLCIAEWSKITGIAENTINMRLNQYGWSQDQALKPTRGKV